MLLLLTIYLLLFWLRSLPAQQASRVECWWLSVFATVRESPAGRADCRDSSDRHAARNRRRLPCRSAGSGSRRSGPRGTHACRQPGDAAARRRSLRCGRGSRSGSSRCIPCRPWPVSASTRARLAARCATPDLSATERRLRRHKAATATVGLRQTGAAGRRWQGAVAQAAGSPRPWRRARDSAQFEVVAKLRFDCVPMQAPRPARRSSSRGETSAPRRLR